jgi:hypothetical protein
MKDLEYRQDGICSTKGAHTQVYEGKLKTLESFTTSHSEVHVPISTYLRTVLSWNAGVTL